MKQESKKDTVEPVSDFQASLQRDIAAKKLRRKKRNAWTVVLWISIALFVVAIVALGVIAFSYWQGRDTYSKVEQAAQVTVTDVAPEEVQLPLITVDWDALRAINPDVVGWVYIPGTSINYPIVQAQDNYYYLTHDFEGTQGWLANYGAIFLEYRNAPDFTDKANFIFGHHMNDGSMFTGIADMADQSRFDAQRTIYLLTPTMNYRLRSFALIHCDPNDPLVKVDYDSQTEFEQYVADKITRSVVTVTDVPSIKSIQQLFVFATCDNSITDQGRYVLYCAIESSSAVQELTQGLELADDEVRQIEQASDQAAGQPGGELDGQAEAEGDGQADGQADGQTPDGQVASQAPDQVAGQAGNQ